MTGITVLRDWVEQYGLDTRDHYRLTEQDTGLVLYKRREKRVRTDDGEDDRWEPASGHDPAPEDVSQHAPEPVQNGWEDVPAAFFDTDDDPEW